MVLRNLIVYQFACVLLIPIIKNRVGFISLSCLFIFLSAFSPFATDARGILFYFIFYLLGAGIAFYLKETFEKRFSKKIAFSVALLLIGCGIARLFANNKLVGIFLIIVGIFFAWIAAELLPIEKKPRGFIKDSFFIYVSHVMVLECIEKIFLIVFGNTLLGAWIDYIVAPVITLVVVFALSKVLRRIPKVWLLLTGNRA